MKEYAVREENAYIGAADERGIIELGEDEFILDSEYRGANRIVAAIATPVENDEHVCDECGDSFDSERGLSIHEGSQH